MDMMMLVWTMLLEASQGRGSQRFIVAGADVKTPLIGFSSLSFQAGYRLPLFGKKMIGNM